MLVAAAVDEFGWQRRRAAISSVLAALVLAVPAMLSVNYILKSDLLWGSVMQPVGSAFAVVGLAWVVSRARALSEVNRGHDGKQIGEFWIFWLRWVVPAGIVLILVLGIADLFSGFSG